VGRSNARRPEYQGGPTENHLRDRGPHGESGGESWGGKSECGVVHKGILRGTGGAAAKKILQMALDRNFEKGEQLFFPREGGRERKNFLKGELKKRGKKGGVL